MPIPDLFEWLSYNYQGILVGGLAFGALGYFLGHKIEGKNDGMESTLVAEPSPTEKNYTPRTILEATTRHNRMSELEAKVDFVGSSIEYSDFYKLFGYLSDETGNGYFETDLYQSEEPEQISRIVSYMGISEKNHSSVKVGVTYNRNMNKLILDYIYIENQKYVINKPQKALEN
jgi:hypothetical protein